MYEAPLKLPRAGFFLHPLQQLQDGGLKKGKEKGKNKK